VEANRYNVLSRLTFYSFSRSIPGDESIIKSLKVKNSLFELVVSTHTDRVLPCLLVPHPEPYHRLIIQVLIIEPLSRRNGETEATRRIPVALFLTFGNTLSPCIVMKAGDRRSS
jgi:hypothetical protein